MQAHLSWQRSDDKDANSETQASSSSSEALSSLTNISYIPSYSTHFNSHISQPLPLRSLPPRIRHHLIKQQTKLTDPTNLASRDQKLTNKQYYKGIQSN
ncbi:unnamed protein product [Brassica oleracea]